MGKKTKIEQRPMRPSALRRRAFRNVSWLVIALLVVSYMLQLAKPHEQQSAYATQQRLVRFVSEAQQGMDTSRAGGVSRVERAQRLFHRFGGLFAAWAGRFWENRAFERAYLRQHFGSLSLAAAAGLNMALGASLLLCAMAAAVSALRASIGVRLVRMMAPPAELSVSVLASPSDSEAAPLLGGAGETTPSRSHSRRDRPRTRLGRLAWRCCPRFHQFYCCAAWPRPVTSREPNRVCNTKALAVKLPLRPRTVCLLKFLASLLVYFSQPDDFFFLFVAFGQIVETGSFRSCGPVSFFCFMFCALEALAAYNQVVAPATAAVSKTCLEQPGARCSLTPSATLKLGMYDVPFVPLSTISTMLLLSRPAPAHSRTLPRAPAWAARSSIPVRLRTRSSDRRHPRTQAACTIVPLSSPHAPCVTSCLPTPFPAAPPVPNALPSQSSAPTPPSPELHMPRPLPPAPPSVLRPSTTRS
jgi:hypothetical protein